MEGYYKARAAWQSFAALLVRFKYLVITLLVPIVLYTAYFFMRPPDLERVSGTVPPLVDVQQGDDIALAFGAEKSGAGRNPFNRRESEDEKKQQERQKAWERHRRRSVTSKFAYDSKTFLASPHTRFDRVAEGYGTTIKGILSPKDAKKKTSALIIHDKFFEEGLESKQTTKAVIGKMAPAGKAKDVAATEVKAGGNAEARSGTKTSARVDFGPSESGLLIASGEPASPTAGREMTLVGTHGGIKADMGVKAVNADSNTTQEVLQNFKTPPPPNEEKLNLPRSSTRGRVQKLERRAPVGSVVEELETGSTKESDISKVTVTQVYAKLGREKKDSRELATELGGAVFDGKQPGGVALDGSSAAEASEALEGANKLLIDEAGEMEGKVAQCEGAEAGAGALARSAMKSMADKGLELRAEVARCRDFVYECVNRLLDYQECQDSGDPDRDCRPQERQWKDRQTAHASCVSALKGKLDRSGVRSQCENYNAEIAEKMKSCSIGRQSKHEFNCDELIRQPGRSARECIVPMNERPREKIGSQGNACRLSCGGGEAPPGDDKPQEEKCKEYLEHWKQAYQNMYAAFHAMGPVALNCGAALAAYKQAVETGAPNAAQLKTQLDQKRQALVQVGGAISAACAIKTKAEDPLKKECKRGFGTANALSYGHSMIVFKTEDACGNPLGNMVDICK